MEGGYLRLERARLRAQPSGGGSDPVLVHLEGWITTRPSAEPSQGLVRTLVVERFLGAHPGRHCPAPAPRGPNVRLPSPMAAPLRANAGERGRLLELGR